MYKSALKNKVIKNHSHSLPNPIQKHFFSQQKRRKQIKYLFKHNDISSKKKML